MKKSILFLAVVALGFAACTSSNSSSTLVPTTDTTAVDTAAVVDSTAVTATDPTTAEIATEAK
jgi:ABC-type oligopeptide transport system substrate-binding subunit